MADEREETHEDDGDYGINRWLYDTSLQNNDSTGMVSSASSRVARGNRVGELLHTLGLDIPLDTDMPTRRSSLSIDLDPQEGLQEVSGSEHLRVPTPTDLQTEEPSITEPPTAEITIKELPIAEGSVKSLYRTLFKYNNSREEAEKAGEETEFDQENHTRRQNGYTLLDELKGTLAVAQDYRGLQRLDMLEYYVLWSKEAATFLALGKASWRGVTEEMGFTEIGN